MKKLERVDRVYIHCLVTRPSQDVDSDWVRDLHVSKGWDDAGYHVIILRDGTIEYGRSFDEQGAHVKGHNHYSLGVALAGGLSEDGKRYEMNYTAAQWGALGKTCDWLAVMWPQVVFMGHRDTDPSKECPLFDVAAWVAARR